MLWVVLATVYCCFSHAKEDIAQCAMPQYSHTELSVVSSLYHLNISLTRSRMRLQSFLGFEETYCFVGTTVRVDYYLIS